MVTASNANSSQSLPSILQYSSLDALKVYEKVKAEVDKTEEAANLEELVEAARNVINDKFTVVPRCMYTHRLSGGEALSVNLGDVMLAMLEYAKECGGESGTRYVASVIVACGQRGGLVEELAAVGETWLTHFLFNFKTPRTKDDGQLTSDLSSLDNMASQRQSEKKAAATFSDNVMIRDEYRCIVTRLPDIKFTPIGIAGELECFTYLRVARIVHLAVADCCENNCTADSCIQCKSAAATFDIFTNFSSLPIRSIDDLRRSLDHPSNGMMLKSELQTAFDSFHWWLKKAPWDNVYTVKMYGRRISPLSDGSCVSFADRSKNYSLKKHAPSHAETTKSGIDLPNPHYIAIRAAIGQVLHMSGAGRFFDGVLRHYKDSDDEMPPVRCWSDLQTVMKQAELKIYVRSTLLSATQF